MPRKDIDERRAYAREWIAARRADWLAAHPCPCGRPSTTIVGNAGRGKITWSWSLERLEAALAGRRVLCAGCAERERGTFSKGRSDATTERQREANRAYMARRRAARREEKAKQAGPPEKPVEPEPVRAATVTGRRKQAARPGKQMAPRTVFDDPEWRRQRSRARQARRRALGMTAAEPADD